GVLRTLSKAWALAGARIGALLAHADVIALLRRIMPPYPLPTPSVEAALDTLAVPGEAAMRQRVALIVAERERMASALRATPGVREVLASQANFLTVRFDGAADVYRTLAARGIVVRDVSHYPGLENCLRISIGCAQDNAQLLDALNMPVASA
ncbi:MAG: aminotransferase class I/II-fold pyridoxal phosphate-dependent enzyme, partial [Xanthomonadales bacterium]|nr:aminotransferase class I/II-fold pyridoxal phosphate-dependent enzyme [Xanthomonadales bacterium]